MPAAPGLGPRPSTSKVVAAAATLPASSAALSDDIFTPLEFCNILHGYWQGRTSHILPQRNADKQKNTRNKGKGKGKGRARASAAFDEGDSESDEDVIKTAPDEYAKSPGQTKRKLLQQGRSLYVKVDLTASPSCVKEVHSISKDKNTRLEVAKLCRMAQLAQERADKAKYSQPNGMDIHAESAASASASPSATPKKQAPPPPTPSKRYYKTAQQILHSSMRSATLESRIYLRLLLSRTILRYIDKITGCKYLFTGDKIENYTEQQDELNKTARYIAYYACANAQYEDPMCGGTLRLVLDLDAAKLLSTEPDMSAGNNGPDSLEGLESLPSAFDAGKSTTKTPIRKVYGNKAGSAHRRVGSSALASRRNGASPFNPLDVQPLSLGSSRRSSTIDTPLSASHASSLGDGLPMSHVVLSVRLTHLTTHKERYKDLRATYMAQKSEESLKVAFIRRKLDEWENQLSSLTEEMPDKSIRRNKALEGLFEKFKRARTPFSDEENDKHSTSSQSSDEDDGPGMGIKVKNGTARSVSSTSGSSPSTSSESKPPSARQARLEYAVSDSSSDEDYTDTTATTRKVNGQGNVKAPPIAVVRRSGRIPATSKANGRPSRNSSRLSKIQTTVVQDNGNEDDQTSSGESSE